MNDYQAFLQAKSQIGTRDGFAPVWMPDFPGEVGVTYVAAPGFHYYAVGDDGSVWCSLSRNGKGRNGLKWRRLKPRALEHGHLSVGLRRAGECVRWLVHRLVLTAFVGPCPEGMEACHFPDRNPSNNRLGNLRWDTHSGNMADTIVHGTSNRGEKHPLARLTESQVHEIRLAHAAGNISQGKLGAQYGVDRETIGCVVRRESWRHV